MQRGVLSAGSSSGERSISDTLAIGGEGKISAGIGEVTAALNVSTQLIRSALKTSLYTTYTHHSGTVRLAEPELTPLARRLLSNPNEPALEYTRRCGDEYLSEVELGAKLHMGFEFTFDSVTNRNQFDTSVTVEAFKIEKTLFEVVKQLNLTGIKAAMNIIFLQEGGDMEAFAAQKEKSKVTCQLGGDSETEVLESYRRCLDVYKDLLEYATRSFPGQISRLTYGDGRLGVIRYHTRPYEQAGFPELQRDFWSSWSAELRAAGVSADEVESWKGKLNEALATYVRLRQKFAALRIAARDFKVLYENKSFLLADNSGGLLSDVVLLGNVEGGIDALLAVVDGNISRGQAMLVDVEDSLLRLVTLAEKDAVQVLVNHISDVQGVAEKLFSEVESKIPEGIREEMNRMSP